MKIISYKERNKESYTSFSLIKQCPYQYKLHYVDKIFKNPEAIAIDIGNLCHKVLELQRNPLFDLSTKELLSIFENGFIENKKKIDGIDGIKNKFFDDFIAINPKSQLSYFDKVETFKKYIIDYVPDPEWTTIEVEMPFSLKINNFYMTGKIDRIDKDKNGNYKVIDYKTSNKVYEEKELTTPLQMYIYALAVKDKYGVYPTDFEYDFVLLGEKRKAMSKGWENRGKRILDKLIEDRKNFYDSEIFPPKPSPLCNWCDYKKTDCEFFSLWTPENKTFDVNKKFDPSTKSNNTDFWW